MPAINISDKNGESPQGDLSRDLTRNKIKDVLISQRLEKTLRLIFLSLILSGS